MIVGWSVLFGLALLLNLNSKKMLALTFIVSAGFFAPVPRHGEWYEFYQWCAFFELCVAVFAYTVKCYQRWPIILCAALLFLCHVMGYWKDGFPELSPYRALVPLIEYMQIICCIVLSHPIVSRLKNNESSVV